MQSEGSIPSTPDKEDDTLQPASTHASIKDANCEQLATIEKSQFAEFLSMFCDL